MTSTDVPRLSPLWGQAASLRIVYDSLHDLGRELATALTDEQHAALRERAAWSIKVAGLHLCGAADRLERKGSAEDCARQRYEAKLNEVHAQNLDEAGFRTRGFMVYMLWGQRDEAPLYVGQSTNILARLGAHLGEREKRQQVERVTILRLTSKRAMDAEEMRLIRMYRPPWNLRGKTGGHHLDGGTGAAQESS